MARDTALTQRRLLEAAGAEFSEEGFAGARVDRIAQRAGVNKERIYSYFGNKDGLFAAVVAEELAQVVADVPLVGQGPEAVGSYAAALFDYVMEHPRLARLMAWEGLGGAKSLSEMVARQEHCQRKVDLLHQALPGSRREDAADLLLTILMLTDTWAILPQLTRLILGDDATLSARRRASIKNAVTVLAEQVMRSPGRPPGEESGH